MLEPDRAEGMNPEPIMPDEQTINNPSKLLAF
jgi:hypothetical protein